MPTGEDMCDNSWTTPHSRELFGEIRVICQNAVYANVISLLLWSWTTLLFKASLIGKRLSVRYVCMWLTLLAHVFAGEIVENRYLIIMLFS